MAVGNATPAFPDSFVLLSPESQRLLERWAATLRELESAERCQQRVGASSGLVAAKPLGAPLGLRLIARRAP